MHRNTNSFASWGGVLALLIALSSFGCTAPQKKAVLSFKRASGEVFQEPQPLVTTMGDELLPSLSPGANRLVYVARVEGNLDIFVRDLNGQNPKRLTKHSTDDVDPAVSPKGDQIAWVSQAEDVKGDIWLMDIDGKRKRRLTERRQGERSPQWSADGSLLYFSTNAPGHSERIDSLDLRSGERRTVVERGWDPYESPKGDVLFYVAHDATRQPRIFALELLTGRTASLSDGAFPEGIPRAVLSGGNILVLFTRFIDDRSQDGRVDGDDPSSLWTLTFDPRVFEGELLEMPRPLTTGSNNEIFPTTRDGWIVYTTSGISDLDLYVLPLSGMLNNSLSAEIILDSARAERNPDKKRLALRHLIATSPRLATSARYEVARTLALQNKLGDAIHELQPILKAKGITDLDILAAMEAGYLRQVARLNGRLLARQQEKRAQLRNTIKEIDALAAQKPDSKEVQIRGRLIRTALSFALGHKGSSAHHLENNRSKRTGFLRRPSPSAESIGSDIPLDG